MAKVSSSLLLLCSEPRHKPFQHASTRIFTVSVANSYPSSDSEQAELTLVGNDLSAIYH